MTGRQEYDRNMTGRQDDRQDDRQRILDEYMVNSKSSKEINLNRDLCGVFLELQAKTTDNYWFMEQNKWKMVFRLTVVDVESRWSAEHF